MSNRIIARGDVFYADLDPVVGSEQGGTRPVLIIQNDTGNRYSHTIIVSIITTKVKKFMPTHMSLNDVGFLEKSSVVLLEQIRTIDTSRLRNYIGSLGKTHMILVDQGLAISLALKKRKPNHMTITLCPSCAKPFFDSPFHIIRRTDLNQKIKESCTYCGRGNALLYVVKPKEDLDEIR